MGVPETIEALTGSVDKALDHAFRLLVADPRLAAIQAEEILKVVPGEPRAKLILGAARRRLGDPLASRSLLRVLAAEQPRAASVHFELGQTLAALGETDEALAALRRAAALKPDMPEAWRALGDQLTLIGDEPGADAAYARQIQASVNDPVLMKAALALCEDDLPKAEHLLREHLRRHPTDVAAIRMLAEAGTRLGRYEDAEALLARCLQLAPSFTGARHNYAIVLFRQQKGAEALPQIEQLLAGDPSDPGYRILMAAVLGLTGDFGRAIAIYEQILGEHSGQPKIWLSYGHALRTTGRVDEAVTAYRHGIALSPGMGEAFWSLANLKTYRFSREDEAAIGRQLAREDPTAEDRLHMHYAIGKALEDRGDYAASFEHYARGASVRLEQAPYDADANAAQTERSKSLFTRSFFAARADGGSPSGAPIFILGLPRSGSTLIEQILASHSTIEGTFELPDIIAIAKSLAREAGSIEGAEESPAYPGVLADLAADRRLTLGEDYLARTRIHRKLGRPYFIDKMPNNMRHIGLIHLILPNARIIDARRHPLGVCFSAFKQQFARGHRFSYDLTDLGRYYRDYVELMDHFDSVLPGRIHRAIYEDMVEDMETEVRRLLDYCGLPFEAACLRFHENERPVRTASSEQVRRPIYRDGLDHWRNYEPWLGPLKDALGPTLETWRGGGVG